MISGIVHEVTDEKVSFLWKGANHDLPVAKFIEAWDGVVLLARSSKKSIEPDYKEHRKTELLNLLKKQRSFPPAAPLLFSHTSAKPVI